MEYQGFAEKLFSKLQTCKERFEVVIDDGTLQVTLSKPGGLSLGFNTMPLTMFLRFLIMKSGRKGVFEVNLKFCSGTMLIIQHRCTITVGVVRFGDDSEGIVIGGRIKKPIFPVKTIDITFGYHNSDQ
ncbi:hypothetical protein L1987_87591 [Smallanthus sonchifolius]|nr:hypothetical protein L1987_87591 [Smallanthus sonchifolius]